MMRILVHRVFIRVFINDIVKDVRACFVLKHAWFIKNMPI